MNAVIRCNADREVGSGHLSRCANIGQKLKARGYDVLFIVGSRSEDIDRFETNSAFSVEVTGLSEAMVRQDAEIIDALACIEILERRCITPDLVLVDSYQLGLAWEEVVMSKIKTKKMSTVLSSRRFVLAAIDDFEDRPHAADIIINPSIYSFKTGKSWNVEKSQKCLDGPMYAPLSDIYGKLHKCSRVRSSPDNLLISFGGSDKRMLTIRVLRYVLQSCLLPKTINVVLNNDSRQARLIKEELDNSPLIRIHANKSCLGHLTRDADFAIGACGMSAVERSCLRLPSIVISRSDEQHRIAEQLHERGALHWAGIEKRLTKEIFNEELLAFIAKFNILSQAQPLTDGQGATRVTEEIHKMLLIEDR